MPKRKFGEDDDRVCDQTVPLPIQTFLWGQTRFKKSFERVLVQNILHGESPALCESIQSISRWRLIQAAFPHIVHCCAALLLNRKLNNPDEKFSASETKLLYTLHWIVLDAASECEDNDEKNGLKSANIALHSLTVIQLFVYLMAPLVHTVAESDFQTLKLENGLRLWEPLWDYQQPDIPCFATSVKPKRNVLKANHSMLKLNTNAANIYIGKGCSADNIPGIYLGVDPVSQRTSLVESLTSPLAPLARMSDVCGTISDTQSVTMEVVCEVCNTVIYNKQGELFGPCRCVGGGVGVVGGGGGGANNDNFRLSAAFQKLASPLDKDFLKQRIENAIASSARGPPNPDILAASYFDVGVLRCLFSPTWSEDGVYWALRYVHRRLLEVNDELTRTETTRERSKSLPVPEIMVSLYRTPSSPKGSEDELGSSMSDGSLLDSIKPSFSVIPPVCREIANKKMRVSELRQFFDTKSKLSRIESLDGDEPVVAATARESRYRKQRDNHRRSNDVAEDDDNNREKEKSKDYMKVEKDEEQTPPPRPSSAMANYACGNHDNSIDDDDYDSPNGSFSDLTRRKSLPSLGAGASTGTTGLAETESQQSLASTSTPAQYFNSLKDAVTRTLSLRPESLSKPIITITEDSPSASPTPSNRSQQKRESLASETTGTHFPQLPRSLTDSNISYSCEEPVEEVTGAVHYIQQNGHINYQVVLKAVHAVTMGRVTARVSETMLNILHVLLDLDVIEKTKKVKVEENNNNNTNNNDNDKKGVSMTMNKEEKDSPAATRKPAAAAAASSDQSKKSQQMTMHNLAMECVIRIFKAMGCPNGCGDGFRGTGAEQVRQKGLHCLQRLQRIHIAQFRKYLREFIGKQPLQDIVDFMHSFLGFCSEVGQNSSSTYSPTTQKRGSQESGAPSRTGYAVNFGQSIGGAGVKGIEGTVMAHILKPLVSRFVESWKELHSHENISIYCDVRQMMTYVKELHGGTFRRVALSGLLDAVERPSIKKTKPKHPQPIKRTTSMTSDSGDEKETKSTAGTPEEPPAAPSAARSRRSLFKRRTQKKQSSSSYNMAASDTETLDDPAHAKHLKLSPCRMSMSATEDDPPSNPSTPKRKFSKFNIGNKLFASAPSLINRIFPATKTPVRLSPVEIRAGKYRIIGWKRSAKSDHEEDSAGEHQQSSSSFEARRESMNNRSKRMSFKAAGQATLSFLTARRRLEDGLKSFSKKRLSKRGSVEEGNVGGDHCGSCTTVTGHAPVSMAEYVSQHASVTNNLRRGSVANVGDQATEVIVLREKKLVNGYNVKCGMLRLSFFLDCCHPGSFPDCQLIAAMLDLEASIVARATFMLECAHFVHRCNRGDWPNWMKLNLPSFRQVGPLHSRNQPSAYKRNTMMQRMAGRMFYSWGEMIGIHLENILRKENQNRFDVVNQVRDENKKKELREEDEEEDFMDEATVNQTGSDCPYALKMVACQLLREITTFLRETYQYIPKFKSSSSKRENALEKTSRKWSSVLSSPVHSDRSSAASFSAADLIGDCYLTNQKQQLPFHHNQKQQQQQQQQQLPSYPPAPFYHLPSYLFHHSHHHHHHHRPVERVQSDRSSSYPAVATPTASDIGSPGDRKISFAVLGERSDSIHSSTTTLSATTEGQDDRSKGGRRLAQGRNKLLKTRRNSGHNMSFKQPMRTSFKLKQTDGGSIKRVGSLRKISVQSIRSDKSDEELHPPLQQQISSDIESPGVMSDENPESPDFDVDDEYIYTHLPWMKVVIQFANTSNFICDHQDFCHPNCYERQQRSCSRLMTGVIKVYESDQPPEKTATPKDEEKSGDQSKSKENLRDKLKRRESVFQSSSPIRRRESTPLLDKIRTDIALMKEKISKPEKKDAKTRKKKEDSSILKYVRTQVKNLCHSPMAIMNKSAPILSEEHFTDMLPVAWELLLENDQELSAAAASVFILSSIKVPDQVQELMAKELQHEDVNQRINGILRFNVLWRFRFQVWPRMEENANLFFKVPPPNIDFVLPSPTIGTPLQNVIDPPWMPHFKTKVPEVTLKEGVKSLVTATTTRRKQQQEMVHKALIAEEDRKRASRENFHLTTVAIAQQAAQEPALHHSSEEHEEVVLPEEINMAAARRMSMAPNRTSNLMCRNLSWRNGSMFWARSPLEGDEERVEHAHSHHMQLVQGVFPSCICAAVLPIIHLLDDLEVNQEGISVAEVADKVIWSSLVEEPILFFRHFLEKLTVRDKQDELFFVLRRLILRMPELPAQTAHALFNYIIGYVMFYVRSPCESSQDAIGGAMALLWMPTLLVTANVPSAKKIIIHGPDLTGIPSQFPIHEDTQFSQILEDSLDFFNIPDDEKDSYSLIDTKTSQMHNLNSYVRDFYFFRRNFYPQLSMVHMDSQDAFNSLQKQAFTLKFAEVGKVLFSTAVLQSTPPGQMQTHVNFVHEELTKLPSFPRKALEAEFSLYKGPMGQEMYGLDMLHKYVWGKLVSTLFHCMTSTFTWVTDIPLFLNVINGTMLLHCDDSAMLRYSLATYISTARHFKHVFSTNGFMYIMPTILRVYAHNQANPLLCSSIEYTCKQFYILHRKPFVLQMFGAIAPILDVDEESLFIDYNKVPPKTLFKLVLTLETPTPDPLQILDLVHGDKPLKALSVLEALVPPYLVHVYEQTKKRDSNPAAIQEEVNIIGNLAISMRALITSCEALTRNISGPRNLENINTSSIKPVQNHSSSQGAGIYYDDREDSTYISPRHMEEGRYRQMATQDEDAELRNEFRKPRDSLLNICVEFFAKCLPRVKELRKLLPDPNVRFPDLLDHKAHNRLADIAHTLLKLAPYDPIIMGCRGLQRYMTEILPITDWSIEAVRPALNLILRRLDRLFNKIYKKAVLRRQLDWDSAANLLKGVYLTLLRYKYVAHLPHLKTVINMCLNIILSDVGAVSINDSLHNVTHSNNCNDLLLSQQLEAPPRFCSAVVKLMAMQMQALGEQFSLEHICGGMSVFPTAEKTLNMLINLIIPLCIRVGSGRRDSPKIRQIDISFSLTVVLSALLPPTRTPQNAAGKNQHLNVGDLGRLSSLGASDQKYSKHLKDAVYQTAFLGLKIIIVCFQSQLSAEWHRIAVTIKELVARHQGGAFLWKFIDFLVTIRPPLYIILRPFIHFKMLKLQCDTEAEYYLQQLVGQRLQGNLLPPPKCSGSILIDLANELRIIKEDMALRGAGDFRPPTTTMTTDFTLDLTQTNSISRIPRPSIADLMEPLGNRVLPLGNKRNSKGTVSPMSPLPPIPSSPPAPPSVEQTPAQSPSGPESGHEESVDTDTDDTALLIRRHSSRRITASDGNQILNKFQRKQQDEAEFITSRFIPNQNTRSKLQRQASIHYASRRAHITKQHNVYETSIETVLYEIPDDDDRGGHYASGTCTFHPPPTKPEQQEVSSDAEEMSPERDPDFDPRSHRLQRQDAKSRKTFKIKRAKTSKTPAHRTVSAGIRTQDERLAPTQEETEPAAKKHHHYIPKSKSHDDGVFDPQHGGGAAAGTARARIARHGIHNKGRGSRSPSTSPVRQQANKETVDVVDDSCRAGGGEVTAADGSGVNQNEVQVYMSRYDSVESISTSENSALLKEDEKTKSQNSLCIYFDATDVQDTCV
ncbi:protein unc-80 homolog [Tubulanus polymorphus]|uniref:protein unc-80 homolog n=1 Tax=Tubulanus polymorphus TaxID=672921 RepID=UPI003DA1DA54